MKAYFKRDIRDGEKVIWIAGKEYNIISETNEMIKIETESNETNYAIYKSVANLLCDIR